jgi:acetolactate synthase-1/3 small subunit
VRSARIAIIKDSKGFHEKLKEFELAEPTQHIIDEPISADEAASKVV